MLTSRRSSNFSALVVRRSASNFSRDLSAPSVKERIRMPLQSYL
jgi:hypothetical protein